VGVAGSPQRQVLTFVMLAAGVVLAVASFLTWVRVGENSSGHFFVAWTVAGWRYSGYLSQSAIGSAPSDPNHPGGVGVGYGDLTLLAGLVTIGLSLVALRRRRWERGHAAAATFMAVVGVIAAVLVLISVRHGNSTHRSHLLVERAAYGLWLTMAVSALLVLLGAIRLSAERK
jgi:hypothetical protein